MGKESSVSIIDHFLELDDPRVNRKKEHLLIDIVVITICAVICGSDDWVSNITIWRGETVVVSNIFKTAQWYCIT